METFKIEVTETQQTVLEVEASSKEDAIRQVTEILESDDGADISDFSPNFFREIKEYEGV